MDSSSDSCAGVERLKGNSLPRGNMSMTVCTELGILFATITGFFCVFWFHIDFGTFLQTGLKTTFLVAVSVFTLQFLISKVVKAIHSREGKQQTQADEELEKQYDAKSKSCREVVQGNFDKQRASYKERILVPREEAKKAKREEEFHRFLGPAWKGKGVHLGGEDSRSSEGHKVQGREAAELRQLPETEIKNIPQLKEPKPKKVIVLPDEPAESEPDFITIVLRTPVHTVHRRRFPQLATVQNVLDYMTTVGFHQVGYTLSTSYPRQNLSELSSQTLASLGFHRQVILNVEEKEL